MGLVGVVLCGLFSWNLPLIGSSLSCQLERQTSPVVPIDRTSHRTVGSRSDVDTGRIVGGTDSLSLTLHLYYMYNELEVATGDALSAKTFSLFNTKLLSHSDIWYDVLWETQLLIIYRYGIHLN